MRALWSGAVSFGLINIPVRLYSASEDHGLNLDMLHKKDLSPIRYARICKAEEKEIPYEDIVKGYKYQNDEYVVVSPDDLKNARKQKSTTIEILQFAKADEIDSIYFEKPYFLEPGKGADKPYALLRETLLSSKKVAIVNYVFRDREHVGILRPYFNCILLPQMRFAEEIRALEDLKLPDEKIVNKKELDMSLKLVNELTEEFHAEAHRDNYTDHLKELIEAKIAGQTRSGTRKKTPSPKSAKIHDITALLEASLKETRARSSSNRKKPKPKKKKAG